MVIEEFGRSPRFHLGSIFALIAIQASQTLFVGKVGPENAAMDGLEDCSHPIKFAHATPLVHRISVAATEPRPASGFQWLPVPMKSAKMGR